MIILINGSIGVGKTAVSWALLPLFERAVMLDGDYFAAIHPFSIHEATDRHYVYRSIAEMVGFHVKNGYRNIIINYVFETADELESMCDLLRPTGLPIHAFLLRCDKDQQEKRIRQRNNDQLEWELSRSAVLNEQLHKNAQKAQLGQALDTSLLSISEVARSILALTQN